MIMRLFLHLISLNTKEHLIFIKIYIIVEAKWSTENNTRFFFSTHFFLSWNSKVFFFFFFFVAFWLEDLLLFLYSGLSWWSDRVSVRPTSPHLIPESFGLAEWSAWPIKAIGRGKKRTKTYGARHFCWIQAQTHSQKQGRSDKGII